MILPALLALSLSGAGTPPDSAAAARVREAFLHAWAAYEQCAWGHDDVRPLSCTARDWYATPLLMTPVDAFDTMKLMGLDSTAARAKALIFERLSFDNDDTVQVFEVTIRLLGGLLSAYQLDGDPRFLALARDLGTRLLPAFRSLTGMPYRYVQLRTGAVSGPVSNPAEIGTLMLEFGTLSKLTRDGRYYRAAKRAVVACYTRRSQIGLVGTWIDVNTGRWTDRDSHVSGAIDSFYEYLLKGSLLFGDADLRRMWEASIGAVNRWLPDARPSGWWYGHADMFSGRRTLTHFGALDAYLPAVLALSGDTARAARLMASVGTMWSTFGIEPEEFDYATMQITSPQYILRPEAIESAYYLYRFTGDQRWQDLGRRMTDTVLAATRAERGFTALANVRTRERLDRMDSFLLAETLKYAYLLVAPPETLDLRSVVFNTEAHPLRRTW